MSSNMLGWLQNDSVDQLLWPNFNGPWKWGQSGDHVPVSKIDWQIDVELWLMVIEKQT